LGRGVSFTRRLLYPHGKSPWYSIDRRLCEPQSLCGHGGEEKNSQTLPGLEPPIIKPVAQRHTSELSRLLARNMNVIKCLSCWRCFLIFCHFQSQPSCSIAKRCFVFGSYRLRF
jgi:hypothetical protein